MNPKAKTLVAGAFVGLLAGLIAGLVYYNSNVSVDSEGVEEVSPPDAGTAVRLGLSMLGFLRLIAD
jgi:uncharacterized membrane protein YagU involved in acid resistance